MRATNDLLAGEGAPERSHSNQCHTGSPAVLVLLQFASRWGLVGQSHHGDIDS
jgi:hypothetical protein